VTESNFSLDLPPSPTDEELFQLFFSFLKRWANLEAQWVSRPLDDTAPLELERSLLFSDPLPGRLVLRAPKAFEILLHQTLNKSVPGHDSPELFVEMVILFWHRFVRNAWKKDARTLKPAFFKSSVPREWPDRRPDSAALVFVKNLPLEIRLWAPLTPQEVRAQSPGLHT
jgi:hypothetical protein